MYRLDRPFSLNIFSLRVIPNTPLEKQMLDHGVDLDQISENYQAIRPTFGNVLLEILMVCHPPRSLFNYWLKKVRAYGKEEKSHRILIWLVRVPWSVQQVFRHLRHGEFTALTGYSGYLLWKIGALCLLKWVFCRKMRPELPLTSNDDQRVSRPSSN